MHETIRPYGRREGRTKCARTAGTFGAVWRSPEAAAKVIPWRKTSAEAISARQKKAPVRRPGPSLEADCRRYTLGSRNLDSVFRCTKKRALPGVGAKLVRAPVRRGLFIRVWQVGLARLVSGLPFRAPAFYDVKIREYPSYEGYADWQLREVAAGGIQLPGAGKMYYPHPLIARQMRQFPILQQPWRRYVTTYDPVEKAYAKRQYRKAERAYRLMANSYQSAEHQSIFHAIWDALK